MSDSASVNVPAVLVVDDDEFSQSVLHATLQQLGIQEIHTANNGRVALRLLTNLARPPDCILCDVFMPDMDGIEFLHELAAQAYPGRIGIMTGVDPQMLTLSNIIASKGGLHIIGTFIKPLSLEQLAHVTGCERT